MQPPRPPVLRRQIDRFLADPASLRNATILTITKGTIDNGSIWLHDGKIQEVGASVKAPTDAKVIDGTGRGVDELKAELAAANNN